MPLPAPSLENGPFVGSGLDGQLTWSGCQLPACSSWPGPCSDECRGSQLGQPGAGHLELRATHLSLVTSPWPWAGLPLHGPGGEGVNLFPGSSVKRAGNTLVVVVLGAPPIISLLPCLGSKRFPGAWPFPRGADSPLTRLRIQGIPQRRGRGKTKGEVDRAGKPRWSLGIDNYAPLGQSSGWVGNQA